MAILDDSRPPEPKLIYRVLGYSSNGTVRASVPALEEEIEDVHDAVMAIAGVRTAVTVGPMVWRGDPDV